MDSYDGYGRDPAGKNCENTNPQTSGLTPVSPDVLNGGGTHVNSTQLPSATAQPYCNGWGRDVSSANSSSTEVTAVGTFSSMNVPDTVEMNEQGFAILPADLFPDKLKNETDFFYKTYNYLPFFDSEQRDENDRPAFVPDDLKNPVNKNVNKWKCCYEKVLKSEAFRTEAKWAYAKAVAAQAYVAYKYLPGKRQVEVKSILHAFNLLFDSVSPRLIEAGRLDELVAVAFSIFYAPCLEGNSSWLKDGCRSYFKMLDVKAVLSEKNAGSNRNCTRVHSVIKQFKKFGTQSAHALFKRKQLSCWDFVIEQTLHYDKDGNVSDKKRLNKWEKNCSFSRFSTHDVGPYLDQRLKAMMSRSGGFKFIVRHTQDSQGNPQMILKNDIGNAIRRAREAGCSTEELVNAMETMVANLHGEDQLLNAKGDACCLNNAADFVQEGAVEGQLEVEDNGLEGTA